MPDVKILRKGTKSWLPVDGQGWVFKDPEIDGILVGRSIVSDLELRDFGYVRIRSRKKASPQ